MSDLIAAQRAGNSKVRVAFGLSGLIALILGLFILILPQTSFNVVTFLFVAYAIVAGIIYLSIGLFSGNNGVWARVGYILLGVALVVAGIIAWANLSATSTWFQFFIAIFLGVLWIVEGIVTFASLKSSTSTVLAIVYGIVSVLAGLLLIFSPFLLSAVIWIIIGISLVVFGVLQIIRGFTFNGFKLR